MLSARSIALQGLGRSGRLVAVQGLWPDTDAIVYGAGRFLLPNKLIDAQRKRLIEADELLLLVCGAVASEILTG
jgi:hypothetical protein